MRTRFMFYLHFMLYKEGLGQFDIKDNNRNFTIPLRDRLLGQHLTLEDWPQKENKLQVPC